MKPENFLYGCMATLLVIAGPVMAAAIQSHASIQTTAETFITEAVLSSHGRLPIARAGSLDSRLRLNECDTPLEAFQPAGGRLLGSTTVGIRCQGTQPWTLYVPVKVSIHDTVVVAARHLSKGMVVQDQDVKLVKKDLAELRSGYYKDAVRSDRQTGRPHDFHGCCNYDTHGERPQLQINRGQRVSLIAESHGLKVQMTGEALADGASGERIRVRNLGTKKLVEGIVISATTVQVAL